MKYRVGLNDIFDESCINIFVDGSIYKNPSTGETIGCPGAIMVMGYFCDIENIKPSIVRTKMDILRGSTNNDTEITAIRLGLELLFQLYAEKGNLGARVNIFSDSNICIQGLRSWFFNWINAVKDGIMYSSSGEPVANQEIFKQIIWMIERQQIHINFFHQKGHVNINNKTHIEKAIKDFNNTNPSVYTNDERFISVISYYNDIVDVMTKEKLAYLTGLGEFDQPQERYIIPVTIPVKKLNPTKYSKLIGRT